MQYLDRFPPVFDIVDNRGCINLGGLHAIPEIDHSENRDRVRMTSKEDKSTDAEDEIQTPFESKTVIIEAGDRKWQASPEEFKALRDRLNGVEFRD